MDYEFFTTFYNDFSIADIYGLQAIKDTFDKALQEWKDDYKYLTELTIILNHKMWIWYERGNEDYSKLYQAIYGAADEYCINNFNEKELQYFLQVTD